MNQPLVNHLRSHSAAPRGTLIKYIFRMGLLWLCATMLLWSTSHPLPTWQFSTLCGFYFTSSLVASMLGYASFWLRCYDGGDYPVNDTAHPFTHTLTEAGLLILELFMALMAAVTVERLLF